MGLTIGQDLSVIGYDGLPEGAVVQPGLTSFAVDSRAAGEELGMLLIRRCRGEAPEDLRRTARAKLVARGSDGPLNT
jgi:LacI family transcriptional regulator